jgi:hypothetical protein
MVQKKEFFRSVIPTFLAISGLFLSISSGAGWEGWIYVVVCLMAALFSAGVTYWWIDRKNREFQNCFGLSESSRINVILSSYQNRVEYDLRTDETRERYYKQCRNERSEGVKKYLTGSREYLVGLKTAKTASLSAFRLGEFPIKDINFVGDEEPRNFEGPIICLGSSTSNCFTEEILGSIRPGAAVSFTGDKMDYWSGEFKPSHAHDYAILVRDKLEDNRTCFVCAGIEEEGTVAVVNYLIRSWKNLPKTRFIKIFKCDRDSFDVIGEEGTRDL